MSEVIERLTREEMYQKYPDTWIGISNIKYENDDGVTVESADIIYIDKSASELLNIQLSGAEKIMRWFTNDDRIPLDIAEALKIEVQTSKQYQISDLKIGMPVKESELQNILDTDIILYDTQRLPDGDLVGILAFVEGINDTERDEIFKQGRPITPIYFSSELVYGVTYDG